MSTNENRCWSERTNSIHPLDESIEFWRGIVASVPDYSSSTLCPINIVHTLMVRFEPTGSNDDLNEAIDLGNKLITRISPQQPSFGFCAATLARCLYYKFENKNSVEMLTHSIELNLKAAASTPRSHPNFGLFVNAAVSRLRKRFQILGSLKDFQQSIQMAMLVLFMTPLDHPNIPLYKRNLEISTTASSMSSAKSVDDAMYGTDSLKVEFAFHREKAYALLTLQKFDLAVASFEQALRLDPENRGVVKLENLKHSGIACDICRVWPIVGIRHKCTMCTSLWLQPMSAKGYGEARRSCQ